MKKIFIVLVMFLLVVSQFRPVNDFTLLDYFSGEYIACTSSEMDSGINYGYCSVNANPTSAEIKGETMILYDCEVASAIETLKARVVKTEYFDSGITLIYAYTNLITNISKKFNKNFNLQFAVDDKKLVIGWPQIAEVNLIDAH